MQSKQITDDFTDNVKLFFKYIIHERDVLFPTIPVSLSRSCEGNLFLTNRTDFEIVRNTTQFINYSEERMVLRDRNHFGMVFNSTVLTGTHMVPCPDFL